MFKSVSSFVLFMSGLFMTTMVFAQSKNEHMLAAEQVNIPTEQALVLHAQHFKSPNSKGGVIVLHDCHSDIETYLGLATSFQKQSIDALVLDLRGFGQSISDTYSHEIVKKQSKDIVSYQQNVALLTTYWGDDALLAYQYLRSKIDKKLPISIVSSGCSAYTAVQLAEKVHLKTSVYIAPEMDFMAKEQYKNLMDAPHYFIGTAHDPESFQTTRELFNWNGDRRTKMKLVKSSLYTANLMAKNSGLFAEIAQWVAFNYK